MKSWLIYILNDGITLNRTASINQLHPILPDFHHIDPSKYLIHLLLPVMVEHFYDKDCQNYIIMSLALSKAIPNVIFRTDIPFA